MIIAFAKTTPALLAGAKTVTRRDWKASHAAKFKPGMLVDAYDKSPRHGGKKVATIRIVSVCRTNAVPASDWEGEGFAWLEGNPPSLRALREDDCWWRAVWAYWNGPEHPLLYVVRFEVEPEGRG